MAIIDHLLLKTSAQGMVARTAKLQQMKRRDSNNAICDDLTGWPQGEAVAISIYQVDSKGVPDENSITDWVAEVNNNTLINMKLTGGVDRDYDSLNTVVAVNFTSEWANRLVSALLKILNQDGTLKEIDGSKIKDSSLDGSKIKPSSVKPGHFDKLVWHDVNYENDFSALDSGGYQVPQYSKDVFGIVRLRGIAKHSQSNVTERIIFRLPVGFRPAGAEIFATPNASSVGRVNINPDGGVTLASLHNPSSSYVSLSGISFQAA